MSSTVRRIASDHGSFDLTIDRSGLPTDIEESAREFGIIWITNVEHPEEEARNVAFFGGPITQIARDGSRDLLKLSGAGLEWHLGTARDQGPIMTGVISLVGPPLTSVPIALEWPLLAEPIPFWVPSPYPPDLGRIDNGVAGIIMAANYSALQTRADYMDIIQANHPGSQWFVNPRTRRVEFGRPQYLHSDIPVLHERGDTDPTIPSVQITEPTELSDWEDFCNQAVATGANITVGTASITQRLQWPFLVNTPYRYATGAKMVMSRGEDHPQMSIFGLASTVNGIVGENSRPQLTFGCKVPNYDAGGPLQPGCRARVWAPRCNIFDMTSTPIEFAGQTINPQNLTVVGVEHGVQAGMGVYWQRGGSTSEVFDLTPWVLPGGDDATLVVGEYKKKNVPRQRGRRVQQRSYAF